MELWKGERRSQYKKVYEISATEGLFTTATAMDGAGEVLATQPEKQLRGENMSYTLTTLLWPHIAAAELPA